MTLEAISERSGISVAVLSKLERNQNICELETLYRLARAFGLSASDLLSLVEQRSGHQKSAERYASGPFHFEKVSFQGIDVFRATAEAGKSLSHPEAHGDEYELCWVLSGLLEIIFSHERYTLGPGEAVKFDAVQEHTYHILEDAELTIVHLLKTHRF